MPIYKTVIISTILYILSLSSLSANMAAPWIKGTNNADGYISNATDILHETINIKIIDTYSARFDITYTLRTSVSGLQTPIIFDNYQNRPYLNDTTFKVWIDSKEVKVSQASSIYNDSIREEWLHKLRNNYSPKASELIAFKYFEADLNKDSIHQIRVSYIGEVTINFNEFLCNYEFEYNLHPAKLWKSFGDLDVIVDASASGNAYVCNLAGDSTSFTGLRKWHFDEIPQDQFSILFEPKVSEMAQFFIAVGPFGITLFVTACFVVLHFYIILRYRCKHPFARFSPAVIIGSFVIPFIFCAMYMIGYNIIELIIGTHASKRHGYTFLVFFFYPFICIFYFLLCLLIDGIYKRKRRNKIGSES